MVGWIKIHRQITDWEWYSDINTCWLFNHLLLTSNFESSRYRGFDVPAGSRVIGLNALASQTPLTISKLRTSLKKLELSGEITIKTTNKFSIISIVKWVDYQTDSKQITNESQTNSKPLATSKEDNKLRTKEGNKEGDSVDKIYTLDGNNFLADQLFEVFWNDYPKVSTKGNKQTARKLFIKLLEKGENHEEIIKGCREYSSFCRIEGQFNSHASTFLNPKERKWEGEWEPGTGSQSKGNAGIVAEGFSRALCNDGEQE